MADNKECKNCGCECHCSGDLHNHHWDGDVCTCEQCNCAKSKAEDLTYESNNVVVVDSTNECEGCG